MAKKKLEDKQSSGIEKFYIDMRSKDSAEEIRNDIIAWGVPEDLISVRKVKNEDLYRLTVDDGQNQIVKIVRMLSSKEYGMSLMDIQEMFGIKITL
jgi:hypothetical protein